MLATQNFPKGKRNLSNLHLFQTGSPLPARMAAMARPIRLDKQDCLTLAQVFEAIMVRLFDQGDRIYLAEEEKHSTNT